LNDENIVFVIGNNIKIGVIPCYPIFIFEEKTIIISSIVLQQIGGIYVTDNIDKCFDMMYGNIKNIWAELLLMIKQK
jgi:hypothetical protein